MRSFIVLPSKNSICRVSGDGYISLFLQAAAVLHIGRLVFGAKAVANPALALAFDLACYLKYTSHCWFASYMHVCDIILFI